MSITALQDYTFTAKYANYVKEEKRREVWREASDRVKNMMLEKYRGFGIDDDIERAYEFVAQKRVIGSQGAMQFGGPPILKKHARIYNCISSYCDRVDFFKECFHLLLCGCGTGFSVQKHHIAKLPTLRHHLLFDNEKEIVIEDSIEGWADALDQLIHSYLLGSRTYVYFNFSQIRAKGEPLSHGMGKAPGPEILMNALQKIKDLLEGEIKAGRNTIRPIVAYDIVMHCADAVVAGGHRRSATIALFSFDDDEMMNAKTGNWFYENPQRGRSNNSVILKRDETTLEQFRLIVEKTRQFGEPGFIFVDDLEQLVNPCAEISFYAYNQNEESGWQACVSGDTRLITKNGIIGISDAVGQGTEIWNGEEWCMVRPFITGENRKLYRVKLSDGSYLDCTDNHKWLVKNRFQKTFREVETKDLLNGEKYTIHTPEKNMVKSGGRDIEFAYEYGFVLGDGTARSDHSPSSTLFGKKLNLGLRGIIGDTKLPNEKYSVEHANITFSDLDNEFSVKLKYEMGLPVEIFNWSEKSIISFISGWIDADGSGANKGCRLYGEEDKIRDAQLLLTSIGIKSSVNLMHKAGEKTNMGTRNRDVWYLQIVNGSKLQSRRIDLSTGSDATMKGKNQVIVSVEELDGLHTTYCVNEEKLHQCVFNNVLTKQCNLSEINIGKVKTEDDFYEACWAAAFIGTLQAGFTEFPYLGEVSEEIIKQEALLGVSMTGVMENPEISLNPRIQKKEAEIVRKTNGEVARKIGINPAARTTCVKPSGSAAATLGVSSGIHPHHYKRYIRRVQANNQEEVLKFFKSINPIAAEDSVWSANKTDSVVAFCCECKSMAKTKDDLSAIDFLENVKSTQINWVMEGKNIDLCSQPWLEHNVSNTCVVKDDEWEDVIKYIYRNRRYFTGISLLSMSGDKDYPQAPFTAVYLPSQIAKEYGNGSILASGLIERALVAFDDNLWEACDAALGRGFDYSEAVEEIENYSREIKDKVTPKHQIEEMVKKVRFVESVKKFADKYMDGDIKKTTYLLKDVYNWKTWSDLQREHKEVDYRQMVEEEDNTSFLSEPSCANGACEIIR